MTEIKVDNIVNVAGTGKPNFPVSPTVGSNAALSTLNTYSYVSSGTAPEGSIKNGALWWDSANNKSYVYINNVWKEIELGTAYSSSSRHGDRGFSVSAHGATNRISRVDITTTGNMVDHADLDVTRKRSATCSSGTYCFAFGGNTTPLGNGVQSNSTAPYNSNSYIHNSISYWESATTNNAADFGDCSSKSQDGSAVSDGTTGAHATADSQGTGSVLNTIDKHTLATPANATDFGDLSLARRFLADCSASNETRGVFACGLGPPPNYYSYNTIDYITIATPGNAADFGDLIGGRYGAAGAGTGSGDRGLFFGGLGSGSYNRIEYVTLSTTGNATDFGDNTLNDFNTTYSGAMNNATRAISLMADGSMSYVTMDTTGNATDFGDQTGQTGSDPYRYVEGVSGNAS